MKKANLVTLVVAMLSSVHLWAAKNQMLIVEQEQPIARDSKSVQIAYPVYDMDLNQPSKSDAQCWFKLPSAPFERKLEKSTKFEVVSAVSSRFKKEASVEEILTAYNDGLGITGPPPQLDLKRKFKTKAELLAYLEREAPGIIFNDVPQWIMSFDVKSLATNAIYKIECSSLTQKSLVDLLYAIDFTGILKLPRSL